MRDVMRKPSDASAPDRILAYDLETIAPSMPDGGFPPWPTHRIIAVGFAEAWRRGNEWSFDVDALVIHDGVDEAALIVEADRRIGQTQVTATLNGRGFDALVLRLAAQRCRLWDLKALAQHAATPRFDLSHADLAELYSSFGRKVGLADLCGAIGVPAKTSVSGGDVAALWEAGERDRIREYVMEDAVATLVLALAWFAARAADEALVTRPLAALARHIEAWPHLHHLHAFVDCALTRWCRPRALRADIAAAQHRIADRLRREEEKRAFVRP